MFYQPGVHIQRPKGYRMKQSFQVAFVVAFCVWVLYQIKHSHDKKKNYGGIPENLFTLEHTVNVLGRKGYVASRKFEEMTSAVPVTASKGSEKDNTDKQKENVKATVVDSQIIDEVEARSSYKEDDAKKIADNTILQSNETNSSLVDKQGELGHGITGYHDENGIPQDDHEVVKFSPNETNWDDNTANDQAILRSHNHSWKKNDKVVEEVETISEEHNASKVEITTMLIRKTVTTADYGNMSDKSEISEKISVVEKVSNYTSRQDIKRIILQN